MPKPSPKKPKPKRASARKAVPMHEGKTAQARMMAGMRFALAGGPTPKKGKP